MLDSVNERPKNNGSGLNQQDMLKKNHTAEEQSAQFSDKIRKKKDIKKKEKKSKDEKESLKELIKNSSRLSMNYLKNKKNKQNNAGTDGYNGQEITYFNLQGSMEGKIKGVKEIQIVEIQENLQQLVDKIHVSAKDAVGGTEVRLHLKDSVLPGTEIRINRHGGEVSVMLNTTSVEAHNFLAQHKASLEKMLTEKFTNEEVKVDLFMSDNNNDNNEGRSRNEYIADEEKDDQ